MGRWGGGGTTLLPTPHGIRLAACQPGWTRAFVCRPSSFSRPLCFPARPTDFDSVDGRTLTTPSLSPHLTSATTPFPTVSRVPFGYSVLRQAGIALGLSGNRKFILLQAVFGSYLHALQIRRRRSVISSVVVAGVACLLCLEVSARQLQHASIGEAGCLSGL